uniref:Uncharacterized protein n=1 Tax=Ananas comosus var. bracteatus TaxID=296719 RepID=A0A6V7NZF5_ANACO|nr:unnamed protein product [Ananas comosus var. bracteatus]
MLAKKMVSANAVRYVVGIIGNVISFGLFLAPVPTFAKIWKRRAVEEFSPIPYLVALLNCMLWVFYGIPVVHPHSILVTINGVGFVLESLYLLTFSAFSPNRLRLKVLRILSVELLFMGVVILVETSFANTRALWNPLIGHDGRFIACSGKNLFAFDRNGSVAWIVPLYYVCRKDIAPYATKEETKAMLMALDVSTGSILWQHPVGPLSGEKSFPIVDSNGDDKAILLFLFFQLVIVIILAVIVRFCCIFWRKKKLQGAGLQRFLEKRRSLHIRRKTLNKIISELEQKAAEDATAPNEALEQLGEIVKAKEGVERKLSTSYSLGRDRIGAKQRPTILPLYNGKAKSHSFHSTRTESVTIFNTLSNTSTSEEGESSSSSSSSSSSYESEGRNSDSSERDENLRRDAETESNVKGKVRRPCRREDLPRSRKNWRSIRCMSRRRLRAVLIRNMRSN